MGSQKFEIKTYQCFTSPVVEYIKRVYDLSGNILPISPGKETPTARGYNSFSIDLHEIRRSDEGTIPLRELSLAIIIELLPDWVDRLKFESDLPKILNNGEDANSSLALTIRLVCPKLNFVIESRIISITDIYSKTPIKFHPFYLDDVVGKVEVQSELVRVKHTTPSGPTLAFSNLNILARNRSVSFFIDEVDDIGGTALPILPGDTKDKMFVIKNSSLTDGPPVLIYHKQFKDFFNNGDDYETVQAIMILIGLPYAEQLLKWVVYGNPNYEKKEHKALIKYIGELCEIREYELKSITEEADELKKRDEYLKLSACIFDAVQNVGSGWKKMLYNIVRNEK
ncbi:MAG: hypothetical protein K0S09_2529 [Sphingobacteriaceae bacterium]|jgi:hypothetical protein|nr:hypothetical protein [Sphingobacteriaceae bacterium]